MIWNLVLLGVGFVLFVAGLWLAWDLWVSGLVLVGCGLMLFGAVRDDGQAR